ncbi:MAG: XrtA-associated tyrosine autokinase [Gammaproteobacteria bacterium]|nr:XrtA-associated tyrosine autokinase [Gammaproteobacteria bacterium]
MSTGNKEQSATTITQLVESSHSLNEDKIEPGISDSTISDNVLKAPDARSCWKEESGEKNKDGKKVTILDRLLAANMLVPGSKLGREIQDDYRRIKRPLVSNACGRNKAMVDRGNLIMVTSSIPGEGKTYSSVNLALSIAQEIDTTVLLVDCDVAKQGLSRMLGLETICGLVDVLENDNLTVGDVMLQTDIPNLRLLSAGKQSEYVAELLASQRMSSIVNEMADRYNDRIIIFDGPPLLPTPQTQILAGLVGQVVFVIEAGKTSQSLVEEALGLIPEEQATGLLLNKNEGLSSRGGYYYGYYGSDEVAP